MLNRAAPRSLLTCGHSSRAHKLLPRHQRQSQHHQTSSYDAPTVQFFCLGCPWLRFWLCRRREGSSSTCLRRRHTTWSPPSKWKRSHTFCRSCLVPRVRLGVFSRNSQILLPNGSTCAAPIAEPKRPPSGDEMPTATWCATRAVSISNCTVSTGQSL
jgi:hypothetical protein